MTALIVLASATEGRRAEFRQFYDEVHVPEVRARYPGIASLQRYDLRAALAHGDDVVHDSMAIYQLIGSAEDLWQQLRGDRTLTTSPAFDYTSVKAIFA
jgi:hypothetical protein